MDEGYLCIALGSAVVWGIVASVIASSKGRMAVGWFFGGFVGGLLCIFAGLAAVILVAVLPNLNAERNYRMQMEQANHRLREQLRQERMKTEAFRQYSASRLDAHDKALGVDTRTIGPALEGPGPRPQLIGEDPAAALGRMAGGEPAEPEPERVPNPFAAVQNEPNEQDAAIDPEAGEKAWFYAHSGNSYGPVTRAGVERLIADRILTSRSLVWTEGMVDWEPISTIPDFRNSGAV